jgi:predicted DCC family thiol-disulfide oxidoreductase YuxK
MAVDFGKPTSAAESVFCPDETTVVYDGSCPFCSWYVDRLSAVGELEKLDARDNPEIVHWLDRLQIDINRDMVLFDRGRIYKGSDALCDLARRCSPQTDWFSKLNRSLFSQHYIALIIYPVLRILRNIYLWCAGRTKI